MIKLLLRKEVSLFCLLFGMLLIVSVGSVQAQNDQTAGHKVSGTVIDAESNEPIPGVNYIIQGTTLGGVTDLDGKYEIVATQENVIVFSYVGYVTQEFMVGTKTVINVSLMTDYEQLGEVVVIGYGVQKKSHVTGSIAKLETNEYLSQMPVADAGQVLQGQLAGVIVQNTSAEAGAAPKVTIRGITSINSSNNPLVVVDGYPIPGDLSTVNMIDVESVEVLKDAASASIYGSRGSNGVILVTTKSGKEGKTSFQFNAYAGIKSIYKKPNIYPTPSE